MAKRRRKKSGTNQARRDDVYPITSPKLPRLSLTVIADHRTHHPVPSRRRVIDTRARRLIPRVLFRRYARNASGSYRYRHGLLSRLMHHDRVIPRSAVVCVRRQQRREVIFARGRAGRGSRRQHPRYNENSKLTCRR